MPNGLSRFFVLNGLSHADQILGAEVFDPEDWAFGGQWSEEKSMHESFYVAKKAMTLEAGKETFSIKQGDRIRAITSGKWTKRTVAEICRKADIEMVQSWVDHEYGEQFLSLSVNFNVAVS
jgi:tRNA-specific adenosine deaminase 2